ncbi:MAG: YIP1 family protein [Ectothiorhodospiraceae bacterium]|nr:YIP1 family protein [Ectothiorhodospiraceae bacterium]
MNLVERAKNILMAPKEEWAVVAGEEANQGNIITTYVLPMAALPAIATVIGSLFFGSVGMAFGIGTAVVQYIVSIIGTFVTALVVNALANSFQSEQDSGRAMQLVAYASTGSWVGGILNIIPFIGWLGGLAGGIYSIYLLYLGFPHTMKTPQDKVIVYMIVTIIVLIIIYMILGAILSGILFAIIGVGASSMMGGF